MCANKLTGSQISQHYVTITEQETQLLQRATWCNVPAEILSHVHNIHAIWQLFSKWISCLLEPMWLIVPKYALSICQIPITVPFRRVTGPRVFFTDIWVLVQRALYTSCLPVGKYHSNSAVCRFYACLGTSQWQCYRNKCAMVKISK